MTLQMARHLLRRESQAMPKDDELATAHELMCELSSGFEIAPMLKSHLAKNDSCDAAHVLQAGIVGAFIGLAVTGSGDCKAAFSGLAEMERSVDRDSVIKSDRDWLAFCKFFCPMRFFHSVRAQSPNVRVQRSPIAREGQHGA